MFPRISWVWFLKTPFMLQIRSMLFELNKQLNHIFVIASLLRATASLGFKVSTV